SLELGEGVLIGMQLLISRAKCSNCVPYGSHLFTENESPCALVRNVSKAPGDDADAQAQSYAPRTSAQRDGRDCSDNRCSNCRDGSPLGLIDHYDILHPIFISSTPKRPKNDSTNV